MNILKNLIISNNKFDKMFKTKFFTLKQRISMFKTIYKLFKSFADCSKLKYQYIDNLKVFHKFCGLFKSFPHSFPQVLNSLLTSLSIFYSNSFIFSIKFSTSLIVVAGNKAILI